MKIRKLMVVGALVGVATLAAASPAAAAPVTELPEPSFGECLFLGEHVFWSPACAGFRQAIGVGSPTYYG